MSAVLRAAGSGARRRRVQSLVIGAVVLLSAATGVLALGLIIASSAPFDKAFARQNGAHAAVTYASSQVPANPSGVTASAGPYATIDADLEGGHTKRPPGAIVGRETAGDSVDRLAVSDGSWLTGPGQIVLSPRTAGYGQFHMKIGDTITVGVEGSPVLTVVGIASSATSTATAWVWPTESFLVKPSGWQMLYRLADPSADLSSLTAGLPVVGSTSWLAVKAQAEGVIKVFVPFILAFAVLGLVLSVMIVVNVVSGAVVAGFRTIGVQKSLGFTPGQITAIYAGQVLIVGIPAGVLGVVLGHFAAIPLLSQTSDAYQVSGVPSVPLWVDAAVLLGVLLLVAAAAAGPALRAGRFSAVQALTVGRAPRGDRGVRIRRVLAALPLPRAIGFGLGTPFARPARSLVTVVAVLLGVTTVVFAAGLAASLTRISEAGNRTQAVPVRVGLAGPVRHEGAPPPGAVPEQGAPPPGAVPEPRAVDTDAIRKIIEAQPGTAHVAGETEESLTMAGYTEPLTVRAYQGDASWAGYPLINGRWYSGVDEAVAGSRMLKLTGTRVGDTITLGTGKTVTIVGEVFSNGSDATIMMDMAGFDGFTPRTFEVGLTEGTSEQAYASALRDALPEGQAVPQISTETQENEVVAVMIALITTLTVLLTTVAGLGVFNTVMLNTRERIHEIGVLKSVGMTPGQVRLLVLSSVALIGALGGALAVPLGYALHGWALPVMAESASLVLPASILDVYRPWTMVLLGAAGVLLASLGALVPGGWAARTRASSALRAE
ncbi:FtsX-like permease family protein [Actinoplanes sp. CA-015351]|uniref:FtsX-like permease family protein n=1 Tax=Actinoplanes sp. CA-015351 TaxID=3239897 RepID=UPI003D96B874